MFPPGFPNFKKRGSSFFALLRVLDGAPTGLEPVTSLPYSPNWDIGTS